MTKINDVENRKDTIKKLTDELEKAKTIMNLAIDDLKVNGKCPICKNLPENGKFTDCPYYASCGLAYVHFKWRYEDYISLPTNSNKKYGTWILAECSEKDGNANCSECGHWDWNDCKFCSECGIEMKTKENEVN